MTLTPSLSPWLTRSGGAGDPGEPVSRGRVLQRLTTTLLVTVEVGCILMKGDPVLDPELLYVKARQRELWQEAAEYALVKKCKVDGPRWRKRWLRHLGEFLSAYGLRAPVCPTTPLVPAVVRVSKQRQGGSKPWQNR